MTLFKYFIFLNKTRYYDIISNPSLATIFMSYEGRQNPESLDISDFRGFSFSATFVKKRLYTKEGGKR